MGTFVPPSKVCAIFSHPLLVEGGADPRAGRREGTAGHVGSGAPGGPPGLLVSRRGRGHSPFWESLCLRAQPLAGPLPSHRPPLALIWAPASSMAVTSSPLISALPFFLTLSPLLSGDTAQSLHGHPAGGWPGQQGREPLPSTGWGDRQARRPQLANLHGQCGSGWLWALGWWRPLHPLIYFSAVSVLEKLGEGVLPLPSPELYIFL